MAETKLWTAALDGKEIRAEQFDLHAREDSADLFSAELRITRNGEVFLRQVFHDARKLHARSMEVFEKLVARGSVRQ
jgi:hypothetical protein